jgi:hypothetical protein
MESKVYLQTGKDQLVDATEIVPLSELLNELKETYDDEPIEVMVGDPATVHQQTLDAVEAIKMLPELTKMLNAFNHPVKQETKNISSETMKELHDRITTKKMKWSVLSSGNPVYDWLFPLCEYTDIVNCTSDVYTHFSNYSMYTDIQEEFENACRRGRLEVAKWLVSLGGVNIYSIRNNAFRWACQFNHLEVAKWLVSLGVDIHTDNDIAFRIACDKGYFEMIKWFESLGINFNHCIFEKACRWGKIEIAKWLYMNFDVDLVICNDCLFQEVCECGHLEVAKWLYSLGDVDIHAYNDFAIKHARENNHVDVVEWLESLE